MPAKVKPGIGFNLDPDLIRAALPLFESGHVECMEWSFDAFSPEVQFPEWFEALLQAFASHNGLLGHGIFFSLFSGAWQPAHTQWLKHLSLVAKRYQFSHISEHFGYMTGTDFHTGAPIPFPLNQSTKRIGIDRLLRIQDACLCPVGLENLAFSFNLDEVKRQGEFLDEILEAVNGFLILDLHNVYCQVLNFGETATEICRWFPLERVREVHVSGGSWQPSMAEPGRNVRRDTHDNQVPTQVFETLVDVFPNLPNLGYVVLEQINLGLSTETRRKAYGKDFEQLCKRIEGLPGPQQKKPNHFLPADQKPLAATPAEDTALAAQQSTLKQMLESAPDFFALRDDLNMSPLKNSDWNIEKWEPAMLETAMLIAQKWKGGIKNVASRQ